MVWAWVSIVAGNYDNRHVLSRRFAGMALSSEQSIMGYIVLYMLGLLAVARMHLPFMFVHSFFDV
jgi:hypothetical protein